MALIEDCNYHISTGTIFVIYKLSSNVYFPELIQHVFSLAFLCILIAIVIFCYNCYHLILKKKKMKKMCPIGNIFLWQTFEAWFSRFSSCGGAFDELSMQTLGKRYQEKATLISQLVQMEISCFMLRRIHDRVFARIYCFYLFVHFCLFAALLQLHQTIEQRGTIIHGDFKTANLFFKKGVDISESQNFHMAGLLQAIFYFSIST